MNIPEYITDEAKVLDKREFDEGKIIVAVENTHRAEFDTYIGELEKNGYEQVFKNEVPCENETAKDNVTFLVLKGKDGNAYASFYPFIDRAQVIFDSITPLHSHETVPCGNVTPTITQCTHTFGMSYCIKLSDNSLIIIDGGYRNEIFEGELARVVEENTPKGQKAVISMWFFTHMDPDHILLASDFLRDYRDKVEVKGFAYSYPRDSQYGYSPKEEINGHVAALETSMKQYFPETPVYMLYSGDMYPFAGLNVHVLNCFDLMHPRKAFSPNCESAVFRFEFANGKNVIFLGDSVTEGSKKIAKVYGKALKSDVLQVAHHGLIGGDLELYQLIDPDICFWPVMKERFEGTHAKEKFHYCLGEGGFEFNKWIRDDSVKKRRHYHQTGTVCLDLDTLEAAVDERIRKFEFKSGVSADLMYVYSPICKVQKQFTLDADCVVNGFNEEINDYDYISVATGKKYKTGITVKLECLFEKYGAPLVVFSNDIRDENGVLTYGHHYEVVAYENGINIWSIVPYPERDERPVKPTKIGFLEFPVKENEPIELEVKIDGNKITASLCGQTLEVTDEQIPENFHVGVTACEGNNKIYEMYILDGVM